MRTLLLIQSLFYISNGLWPILHYRSFAKVTGPKKDIWLVVTVGWMITVSGFIMLISYFLSQIIPIEIFCLAAGDALCLVGIDIYYVKKKVISPVYLIDASIEGCLLLSWAYFFFKND